MYTAAAALAASQNDGSGLFQRGTIGKQHKDQTYRVKYLDGAWVSGLVNAAGGIRARAEITRAERFGLGFGLGVPTR